MKIIILAAGIGSRLGNPFPKPLTPLKNGKSIMQRQMDSITTYFDINDITTVVGFKKNLIMFTIHFLIQPILQKVYYVP
jgi:choline kinase